MRKNNKPFKIPDQFFNSLNEFTNGGFIIFSFDVDGNPVINSNFDTIHHANSMHIYMKKWIEAVEVINSNMAISSLIAGQQQRNNKKKN